VWACRKGKEWLSLQVVNNKETRSRNRRTKPKAKGRGGFCAHKTHFADKKSWDCKRQSDPGE